MRTVRLPMILPALLLALGIGLAMPHAAEAFTLIPACARVKTASDAVPGLDCALETFKNVSFLLYGISGSVALLFFVYGGFLILLSGFAEQVAKGKGYIKNATIGLIIIMVSSYATDYFIGALLAKGTSESLGAPCGGKGVIAYRYDPSTQQTIGTKPECVTTCEQIGPGYSCTSGASAEFGSCADIIKCGDGQRCCLKETR